MAAAIRPPICWLWPGKSGGWWWMKALPTRSQSCRSLPQAGQAGLLVLRSFGKFYGLAGVRLGFVIGCRR